MLVVVKVDRPAHPVVHSRVSSEAQLRPIHSVTPTGPRPDALQIAIEASGDTVALMMALRHPDVEVVGVGAVSGNVPLDQAVQHALYTRK
jgi:hypothetical protein